MKPHLLFVPEGLQPHVFAAGMKDQTHQLGVVVCLTVGLLSYPAIAAPPESFSTDVRQYLTAGYVTNGTVDYQQHIQKCFDESTHVFFPGSDDPEKPMIYGSTTGLKTGPNRRLRFGPNVVLNRLPSLGDFLTLGASTHLTGAVIDGNKCEHWPLMKDREGKAYACATRAAVKLLGSNLLRDCFVYHNAGIAFGAWGGSHNRLYRCRAECCGFLEALGDLGYWGAEKASADGFYFGSSTRYNIVKDSEAIDCSRWGWVLTDHASNSSFVDCRRTSQVARPIVSSPSMPATRVCSDARRWAGKFVPARCVMTGSSCPAGKAPCSGTTASSSTVGPDHSLTVICTDGLGNTVHNAV